MSESADYDPGVWRGHDFKSARAAYHRDVVDRGYDDAVALSKKHADLLPKTLATNSTSPLVIVCDVTGSMGEWPATIFSKLPYLDHEVKTEYLGVDAEICFAAVGDANCDQYPAQARPFSKGKGLAEQLKGLVIEGGGGGQIQESYELMALYFARNVAMPKAVRPVLIFIGDEAPYEVVSPEQAKKVIYTTLNQRILAKEVFEELKQRFDVYLIRKPYGSSTRNEMDSTNQGIHSAWVELLGEDHVCILPEPGRVVDVIFGILARAAGRVDYFRKELEDRQTKKQVDTVYKALKTVHGTSPVPPSHQLEKDKSTLHRPTDGGKTKPLI